VRRKILSRGSAGQNYRVKRSDNLSDFYADVKKSAEKDGEVCAYTEGDGKGPRNWAVTFNPADLLATDKKIHELLMESHGADVYEVDVKDNKDTVIGEYRFGVGKQKKRGRAASDDDDGKKPTRNDKSHDALMEVIKSQGERNDRLVEKYMDRGDQGSSTLKDAVEIVVALKQDRTPLEELAGLNEYLKSQQPTVEKDDLATTLLNAGISALALRGLPGILPQAAARGIPQVAGGSPPSPAPPPGSAEGTPTGPSPGLPAAGIGGDNRTPAGTEAGLPPPIAAPGFSTPSPPPVTTADQPAFAAATAPDDRHAAFEKLSINTFRASIQSGAPVEQLFGQIIKMAQDVRLFMPDNLHPLVKDLAEAQDGFSMNAAFSDFCRNVPELAEREDLQAGIRDLFIQTVINPQADDQPPDDQTPDQTAASGNPEPTDVMTDLSHIEVTGEDHEQSIQARTDQDRTDGETISSSEQHDNEESPVG